MESKCGGDERSTAHLLDAQLSLACHTGVSWSISPQGRGAKTWVAGWHCHPESFCASGKFLRVTLEIALGSFRTLQIISGQAGYFPDDPENFRIAWKVSGQAGYFPDDPENFWIAWKASGQAGYFPDDPKNFRIAWKVSGQAGYFPDDPENFRIAWKVSGQPGKFLDNLDIFWMVC